MVFYASSAYQQRTDSSVFGSATYLWHPPPTGTGRPLPPRSICSHMRAFNRSQMGSVFGSLRYSHGHSKLLIP